MGFKKLSIINRLKVSMITVTSFLVLIMAIFVGVSVLSPMEDVDHVSKADRNPAAIVSSTTDISKYLPKDDKMVDWNLKCLQSKEKVKDIGRAHQVRILGKVCDRSFWGKLKKATIVNRTNGFEATGFLINKNQFTSDYIYLNPGSNNLFVSLEEESGRQVLSEVTVLRE